MLSDRRLHANQVKSPSSQSPLRFASEWSRETRYPETRSVQRSTLSTLPQTNYISASVYPNGSSNIMWRASRFSLFSSGARTDAIQATKVACFLFHWHHFLPIIESILGYNLERASRPTATSFILFYLILSILFYFSNSGVTIKHRCERQCDRNTPLPMYIAQTIPTSWRHMNVSLSCVGRHIGDRFRSHLAHITPATHLHPSWNSSPPQVSNSSPQYGHAHTCPARPDRFPKACTILSDPRNRHLRVCGSSFRITVF